MIVFEQNFAAAVAPFVTSERCPSDRLRNAVPPPIPETRIFARPTTVTTDTQLRTTSQGTGNTPATRLEELELANAKLTQTLAQVTSDRDALVTLLRDRPIIGAAPADDSGQLQEAKAAADQARAAYEAEVARSRQFQEELGRLREARDELNRKLDIAARTEADTKARAQEMESRLRESAAELQRAKGELEKHAAERNALEKALGEQLTAAKAAADKAAAEAREAKARQDAADEAKRRADAEQARQAAEAAKADAERLKAEAEKAAADAAKAKEEAEKARAAALADQQAALEPPLHQRKAVDAIGKRALEQEDLGTNPRRPIAPKRA